METQQDDVDFFKKILGKPKNILEVACGGGRIAIPLAQAGHNMTGFDADEHMLLRCYKKAKDVKNVRIFKADAITGEWGSGYDIVLIGGNFLINIEAHNDYANAQQTLISNAASALKQGGYLLMDFDMYSKPEAVFNGLGESSYFKGTDDLGTYGRTISYGGAYNPATRICVGPNHMEITTNNGDSFIKPSVQQKHIPSQEQVWSWIESAGFAIEKSYKNYTDEPVPIPLDDKTYRVTLLAMKK